MAIKTAKRIRVSGGAAFLRSRLNIGNPGKSTIRKLAELVIESTASKSKQICKILPSDLRQPRPDVSKAKAVLGWKAKIRLKVRLMRTIASFERMLSDDKTPGLTARYDS
jgi:UDP-glucuronate decarboxylase